MMRRHHDTPRSGPSGRRRPDDFWGDTADWPTSELPAVASALPADRFLDDPDAAPPAADTATAEPYAGLGVDLDADPDADLLADERWDHEWTDDAPRPSVGIDPLVLRVAAVIVALTLAVPLLLGLRSDGGDPDSIETSTASPATTVAADGGQSSTDPSGSDPQATATEDDAPAAATPSADTAAAQPAAACGVEYDVAEGDFWIRIADGAGVELSDLLAVNDATVDSALYPGASICLPEGASAPPPPAALEGAGSASSDTSETALSSSATASSPAEPVPNPRQPPAPAPTTAAAPTPTTAAPTPTTAPAPPSPPPSSSDPVAIIRSVWPDDLEERAITIAWRESNHRPDADNGFCCYGLFQIYYDVHRSWLASDLGITSAQQLFDPVLNAQAAYRLYERAGGWGPWSQTNY